MDIYREQAIRLLLARHGFSFSKSLGQNFLIDREIPAAIAEQAGLNRQMGVVEIGPGIGALTAQLCQKAGKVVSVELDRRLKPLLEETMGEYPNFTLVEGDAMELDFARLCREQFGEQKAALCANLPYNITTPVIGRLLAAGCFSVLVLMVQKEAAGRICALPGKAGYCAFSAETAYYAKREVLFSVPPESFLPPPKVDSAVVRLTPWPAPPAEGAQKDVFRVIRAAFANRRKTFVNALCLEYGKQLTKPAAEEILASLGIPQNIRGEQLSVEDFGAVSVKLSNFLRETCG